MRCFTHAAKTYAIHNIFNSEKNVRVLGDATRRFFSVSQTEMNSSVNLSKIVVLSERTLQIHSSE